MKQGPRLWMLVVGGVVAGALDLAFALSFAAWNGTPAMFVLQGIASGLSGRAAFDGGATSALVGLGLHFAMSILWAVVFVLAARRVGAMVRHPVVAGIVFGGVVFLVMRVVVVPLSAFPYPMGFALQATVLDLLSHALLFGVPIALATRLVLASRIRRG